MSEKPILFVDDDMISNLENCKFLREDGFTVDEASKATMAFDAIDRHGQLAALVTDIDLGPGADGFGVARHARATYPHLPVVFISGMEGHPHPAEGVAGSEFVAKPFHPLRVVEALGREMRLEAA